MNTHKLNMGLYNLKTTTKDVNNKIKEIIYQQKKTPDK